VETTSESKVEPKATPAKKVLENALIWSAVSLSLALLLCVLGGAIHLLPASVVIVCGTTLTYMTAVLALSAVGYLAFNSLKK